MPCHGHGSLSMALVLLETFIQLNHMLAGIVVLVHHHAVRCFNEGRAQIMIGLLRSRSMIRPARAGMNRWDQTSVAARCAAVANRLSSPISKWIGAPRISPTPGNVFKSRTESMEPILDRIWTDMPLHFVQ